MTWLQTYSGKAYIIANPTADQICLSDIAHALANQCRFAGHSRRFYSVAEHSVYVYDRVRELLVGKEEPTELDRKILLAALFHDATEAYLLDIPRPLKVESQMEFYREMHKKTRKVIFEKYKIPQRRLSLIQEADNELLATEKEQVMTTPPQPWEDLPEPLNITISCWTPPVATFTFRKCAESLGVKDD